MGLAFQRPGRDGAAAGIKRRKIPEMNRDPSPPAPEAVREEGEPEDHVLGGRPRSPAGWRKGAAATGGSGKRRAWALTSCPPPAGFAAGRKDPPGPIVSIFPGWRAQLETGTDHVPIVPAGKQLADFAPAVAALRSLMALKTILAPEGADRPCFPLKWAPSRGQDSRAGLCSCLGGGRPLVPAAPPSTVTGTCTRSSAWSLQPDAAGSVDRCRSQGRVISRRLQPSVSSGGRGERSQGFSVSWAAG